MYQKYYVYTLNSMEIKRILVAQILVAFSSYRAADNVLPLILPNQSMAYSEYCIWFCRRPFRLIFTLDFLFNLWFYTEKIFASVARQNVDLCATIQSEQSQTIVNSCDMYKKQPVSTDVSHLWIYK